MVYWGNNDYGQLGDGTSDGENCADRKCKTSPVPVSGLSDLVAINAGHLHACAADSKGNMWCWGYNLGAQLGTGEVTRAPPHGAGNHPQVTYDCEVAKQLVYNATIVERRDHTPQLATFVTQYDEPVADTGFFQPGQYVALGLNNTRQPELGSVRRAMSIASAPEEGQRLEFFVRYVSNPASDNPLTHLLWETKVGDPIFVTRKPVGKFTLEDTIGDSKPLKVLVAAGTGIAPFVSMVRSFRLSRPDASLSNLLLLHGASYPADLCHRDELERAARENGLHYFPTVSRAGEASDWTGHTGRVEDFFLPERLEQLEQASGLEAGSLTPENAGVLVCGLQGTIARCIERLAARRFVPSDRKIREALAVPKDVASSMWWEQYDNNPVIDINNAALVTDLSKKISRPPPAM